MTNEEVLKRVNKQKKAIEGYPPKFIYVGTVDEYNVVVKSLEKQIPKKPVEGKKYEFFTEYSCPCCGCDFEDETMPYCLSCGQAIDWGDEE